jgi:DNA-binding NtrC family response regulator
LEKLKVLIVDDNVICRKAAADAVQATGLGWVAHTAPNASIAMEWLEQCEIDVVLLGARMDGRSTLELLSLIKGKYPVIEIIILCNDDAASAAIAIESLESGALDFIVKPSEAGQEKMVDIIGSRLKENSIISGLKTLLFPMWRNQPLIVWSQCKRYFPEF